MTINGVYLFILYRAATHKYYCYNDVILDIWIIVIMRHVFTSIQVCNTAVMCIKCKYKPIIVTYNTMLYPTNYIFKTYLKQKRFCQVFIHAIYYYR